MGSYSVMAATLCILACICSLQTVAMAKKAGTLHVSHYTHETRGGPNHTLLVAAGTNSANLSLGVGFGSFVVYDNMMKQGSSNTSKLLGRASGVAVGVIQPSASTNEMTRVQLQMTHIFEGGSPYNGSTLSVLGIFYSLTGPWEMTVPGGTGHFLGYSGYGVAKQISETAFPLPVYLVYKWDFYLSKK